MSQALIAGWVILIAGTILWLCAYFATRHPPFIDWRTHNSWWIADYLTNIESEIGMILMCAGTALTPLV